MVTLITEHTHAHQASLYRYSSLELIPIQCCLLQMRETRNDETSSKSNQQEAELCVRLCRYLLQQGYPPDTVTILTAYSGQVFALKNIMQKEQTFYQGEF